MATLDIFGNQTFPPTWPKASPKKRAAWDSVFPVPTTKNNSNCYLKTEEAFFYDSKSLLVSKKGDVTPTLAERELCFRPWLLSPFRQMHRRTFGPMFGPMETWLWDFALLQLSRCQARFGCFWPLKSEELPISPKFSLDGPMGFIFRIRSNNERADTASDIHINRLAKCKTWKSQDANWGANKRRSQDPLAK